MGILDLSVVRPRLYKKVEEDLSALKFADNFSNASTKGTSNFSLVEVASTVCVQVNSSPLRIVSSLKLEGSSFKREKMRECLFCILLVLFYKDRGEELSFALGSGENSMALLFLCTSLIQAS